MTIPSIPGVNLPAGIPDPNAIAGQVTAAAQGAAAQGVAAGSAAANSALTGMGVPPGVANQVTGALSDEAMKGFHAAMRAIAGFPKHIFGGLFHHHKHVHAIPQVAQVVASLPPAQQAGANAALNVVNATMAGQTAATVAPAGAPPAQVAAALQAAGTPPADAPGVTPPATHPLVYGGLGAVVTGGVALALKAAYPVAAAAAAGGALLGYLVGHHTKAPTPSAHGEADDAADALLSFIRHNGVPAFPVQAVADFQSAVGLQPVDGRYTAQVQMALAMASSGGGTIPNPVLP